MIVTAQSRIQNGEVESDGEADEMKMSMTMTNSAEPEMIVESDRSPGLHRTLSAREKRRNEMQVFISFNLFS